MSTGALDSGARAGQPRNDSAVALGGALVLVAAVVAAYANSLSGPFVYDDKTSIVYNGTIRHLWPLKDVLVPPGGGATVNGRPILNLSFALNYAFGGLSPRGYHLTNVAIHVLAALTLFGLIRGVIRLPAMSGACRNAAASTALAVAGFWSLHPLDTEAVTYVAQRAESLMSLFYLLTLYAFVRGLRSSAPLRWFTFSWLACVLGMGTKENMVSAPVVALVLDRAFAAGSFASAWRLRKRYYIALFATWIPLGALVVGAGGDRGGSAGFDVGVGWFQYLLTQVPALGRYAALVVWPHPLAFDYGTFFVSHPMAIVFEAIPVLAVIAGTGFSLWRYPKVGCAGFAALAILSPTSLIPGVSQMVVEHRMYLPLAAVLALLVPVIAPLRARLLAAVGVPAAVSLAAITAARNAVYRSELSLWGATVAERPENAVARSSYGAALEDAGRHSEAIVQDRVALRLDPDYGPTLSNLGIALTQSGRPADALPYALRAVQCDDTNAQAHLNLGVAFDLLHRPGEALSEYAKAARLNPLLAAAQNDYGDALARSGKSADGLSHLEEAVRLQPDYPEAYFNRAAALARIGRMDEATRVFAAGSKLRPGDAAAHAAWAGFLFRLGKHSQAVSEYQVAIAIEPARAETHYGYGTALAAADRFSDAIREFETAIRRRPDYPEAEDNLANCLIATGRIDDAITHYEASLKLRPNDPETHDNLGIALARRGALRAAAAQFQKAVQLAPGFQKAREHLEHAGAQLDAEPAADGNAGARN